MFLLHDSKHKQKHFRHERWREFAGMAMIRKGSRPLVVQLLVGMPEDGRLQHRLRKLTFSSLISEDIPCNESPVISAEKGVSTLIGGEDPAPH